MTDKPKTVWILGSGFSKGVGGPLLYELLTPSSYEKVRARYSFGEGLKLAYNIYWQHNPALRERAGFTNFAADLWNNAEEFLTFVDALDAEGDTHRKRLFRSQHATFDGPALRKLALRAVAAECLFTRDDPDLYGEDWQPYRRWAGTLDSHDTIITFNYDLVLELLAKNYGPAGLCAESFILPNDPSEKVVMHQPWLEPYFTEVLKFHGSVNWADGALGSVYRAEPESILQSADELPLIATPGPSKIEHANDRFASIWGRGLEAIRQAERIMFIGYRFPQSDSETRRNILRAIGKNEVEKIDVHIVLGPQTQADDTIRLAALLRTTLEHSRFAVGELSTVHHRRYTLKTHPLYTQDFLTVFDGTWLH